MKVSFRLAALVKDPHRRGLIAEIESETGIERHTVAGMLANTVKYVSIDALAKISDYLIDFHQVDPASLPGALLGRDPERFWDLLVSCGQLDFCLGFRTHKDWFGAEYVMSTDSRLQGMLLSKLTRLELNSLAARPADASADEKVEDKGADADAAEAPAAPQGLKTGKVRRHHPRFHLVPAPEREASASNPGAKWPQVVAKAESVYAALSGPPSAPGPAGESPPAGSGPGAALLAFGSVKVNPVVELVLHRAFGGKPFESLDAIAKASQRPCPLVFRYRKRDPKPPSFCGGMQVAADAPSSLPGLFYELDRGKWECSPCIDESSDAAFLFYAYYPNVARVEIACGGFSSRATRWLTDKLDEIIPALGEPGFVGRRIVVGMYVIEFTVDPEDPHHDEFTDDRPCEHRVIAIPPKVLARRLRHWD